MAAQAFNVELTEKISELLFGTITTSNKQDLWSSYKSGANSLTEFAFTTRDDGGFCIVYVHLDVKADTVKRGWGIFEFTYSHTKVLQQLKVKNFANYDSALLWLRS